MLLIIFCLLIFAPRFESFHAYNRSKIIPPGCLSESEGTKVYSSQFMKKLKLWPGLMSAFDFENGKTLYGSEQALEIIWKNQNPPDCKNAKFIVSSGWPYGFGSRIHIEGIGLAIAVQMGRVYLAHPDGDGFYWETNVPFCRTGRFEPGMNCFYEPFTKCTMADVLEGTGGDVNHLPYHGAGDFADLFRGEEKKQQLLSQYENVKGINLMFISGNLDYKGIEYIPTAMKALLDCSPMRSDAYHYWYRAVSASYIARPNPFTLAKLAELSTLPIYDYEQCISMHVRHGDKGIEMKLVGATEYVRVAQLMWDEGMLPATSEFLRSNATRDPSLSRPKPGWNGTLFVGSEDVQVFKDLEEWGRLNNWRITYTKLFDRAIQSAAKTWDEQHKRGSTQIHDDLEYLSMLLNLQYALRCEAWVCTLASNTCRIMDEMRSTVGGKANRNYADLSTETCSTPPCVGENGELHNFGE